MNTHATRRMVRVAGAIGSLLLGGGAAFGQAAQDALFVGNNGNLEGSISSFTIDPGGALSYVDRVVTGMRASLNDPCPGCNAYSTAITPNGRYIASGHAVNDDPMQSVSVLEVASDASLSLVGLFPVPTSPLDLVWLSDVHLAVTRTSVSGSNEVRTYEFDPDAPSLTLIDVEPTGSFSSSLALDRANHHLFAQDSTANTISSFDVNPDGTLDHIQTIGTGTYPLGLGLAPDGRAVYAGGGISSGGHAVLGYDVNPVTGMLTAQAGSPYTSPGQSPKQVVVTDSGRFAIVAHGTDATMRSFNRNLVTGALVSTGFSFDVGLQGTLGTVAVLGDLVFVTDNSTAIDGQMGVYSFHLNADGSFTQIGLINSTLGIAPRTAVPWSPPPCPADFDGSGDVGFADLLQLLAQWGSCPGCPEDLDGDGSVAFADLLVLLGAWGPC